MLILSFSSFFGGSKEIPMMYLSNFFIISFLNLSTFTLICFSFFSTSGGILGNSGIFSGFSPDSKFSFSIFKFGRSNYLKVLVFIPVFSCKNQVLFLMNQFVLVILFLPYHNHLFYPLIFYNHLCLSFLYLTYQNLFL